MKQDLTYLQCCKECNSVIKIGNIAKLKYPKANEDACIRFQKRIDKFSEQGKIIIYLDENGFEKDMLETIKITVYSP